MNRTLALLLATLVGFALPAQGSAAKAQTTLESFSPLGETAKVRQVVARFSAPMVSFGDPRAVQPFEVDCAEKGQARWVDGTTWAYDFERDVPAGIACRFTPVAGLKSLAGHPVTTEAVYRFTTGGPKVIHQQPYAGSTAVTETQTWLLGLNGSVDEESIGKHLRCEADGVSMGIVLLGTAERDKLIELYHWNKYPPKPEAGAWVAVKCAERLPTGAKLKLVWGKGIASATGVTSEQDQTLAYAVRQALNTSAYCGGSNQQKCPFDQPLRLNFNAAIPVKTLEMIRLHLPDGTVRAPEFSQTTRLEVANSIQFRPPFPPLETVAIHLPDELRDDSGRPLADGASRRIDLAIADVPSLLAFPREFGVLERALGGIVPITLQNVEPEVPVRILKLPLDGDVDAEIIAWLRTYLQSRSWDKRKYPILGASVKGVETRLLKRQGGDKTAEVLGVQLGAPGIYLLEAESAKFAAANSNQGGYARFAALVTNLALHFRRSREGGLVWVTSLDQGKPVAGVDVRFSDCDGKERWRGVSDGQGVVRIPADKVRPKSNCSSGLSDDVVTARKGDDFGLALSGWREGTEAGGYGYGSSEASPIIHTILDRTLFRSGETVSMKHLLRMPTTQGMSLDASQIIVTVFHSATNKAYELKPRFAPDSASATSEWTIPSDAPLGSYRVQVSTSGGATDWGAPTPEFRVEEFRLPTMKAELTPPTMPQVAPNVVPVKMKLTYLSGGGVAQRVRVKAVIRKAQVSFAGYEEFGWGGFGAEADFGYRRYRPPVDPGRVIKEKLEVSLDAEGQGVALIDALPAIDKPTDLVVEMEFADGNGEVQTASTAVRLWPTSVLLGIKAPYWATQKKPLPFQVVALGTDGKPQAGVALRVDGSVQQTTYTQVSNGDGTYRYDSKTSTKELPALCSGVSDERGLLRCSVALNDGGNLTLRASAADAAQRSATASHSAWVSGGEAWTRNANAALEVLPEKRRYAGGETALVQVRVPFAPSTALIAVEREGIVETWVRRFEQAVETVAVPIKSHYAPNMFISVAAVSGRDSGQTPPSAADRQDPGRPRFKLGVAKVEIPSDAFRLEVKVAPGSEVYRTRDMAKVRISVRRADGKPLPAGAEVALAAVDEALLQLQPNPSWDVLSAMFRPRQYGVQHATSAGQPVLITPTNINIAGGGGSNVTLYGVADVAFGVEMQKAASPAMQKMASSDTSGSVRALFDTLLLWRGRVSLDAQGQAEIDVPLNDSLSEFRIVAVAQAGADLFGSGEARIRSSKPLQILAGLPPLVRQGDAFQAQATLRNTTDKPLRGELIARPIRVHGGSSTVLAATRLPFTLAAKESKEVEWPVTVPADGERLDWLIEAQAGDGAADALKLSQKVLAAVPVTVQQATLTQLDGLYQLPVQLPADALPGRGGLTLGLSASLAGGLESVRDYMRDYPHACLEQQVSTAIATRNTEAWRRISAKLESYLDSDGLAKYWPGMGRGSETLTAYLLTISSEARWELPRTAQSRMVDALSKTIRGQLSGSDWAPKRNDPARRLILIDALSRHWGFSADMLQGVQIEPNAWPTSAVIDWIGILGRTRGIPDQAKHKEEAAKVLRARMELHGTTLNFSGERDDYWWWYMLSPDQNAARALLTAMALDGWGADVPRMARGTVLRQKHGRWLTTTANAWGVIALERFAERFEREPVRGQTQASLGAESKTFNWAKATNNGGELSFSWPAAASTLKVEQQGSGRPWLTVQSRAAVPLKAPFASGYRVSKSMEVIQRKRPGVLSRGDVVRIKLSVDAQSDMTWVALTDPVPAGATILSRGLGRDSSLATAGEKREGWVWPSHEEKAFDAFRAYYRFVPKGKFALEYTLRLNSVGVFELPQTRVEAMYAPEMFGELPNRKVTVSP